MLRLSLSLSHNQLKSLPQCLGKLSQLQKLWAENNQLTSLPESLGKLSKLEVLDLTHNELKTLPESLQELSQLQSLYLSENSSLGFSDRAIRDRANVMKLLRKNFDHVQKQRAAKLIHAKPMTSWSVDEVCAHFESLGLSSKDLEPLRKERISGEVLESMSEAELRQVLSLPFGILRLHMKWMSEKRGESAVVATLDEPSK